MATRSLQCDSLEDWFGPWLVDGVKVYERIFDSAKGNLFRIVMTFMIDAAVLPTLCKLKN